MVRTFNLRSSLLTNIVLLSIAQWLHSRSPEFTNLALCLVLEVEFIKILNCFNNYAEPTEIGKEKRRKGRHGEVKPILNNCALVKRILAYKGIYKMRMQTMESNETIILLKRKKVTNFKLFLKLQMDNRYN